MAIVLLNKNTGLAETASSTEEADKLLSSGTHEIPLYDDKGDLFSTPPSDLNAHLSKGFYQPDENQLNKLMTEANRSTTGQKLLSGVEAVGRGALPFGLSTAAEVGLGKLTGSQELTPEAIKEREEINPYGGLEFAGFVGSSLIPGIGQATVLEKTGAKAVEKLGVKAAEKASKGAKALEKAVSEAFSMGAYGAGSQIHKQILNDHETSVGEVAANIGADMLLGGAFGAGIGYVSPIIKEKVYPKIEKLLKGKVETQIKDASSEEYMKMRPMLKKALSVLGGTSEENIEKYIAKSDEINASPDFEDVYESVLSRVNDINESLLSKKSKVSELKQAYTELERDIKNDLTQKGYDLRLSETMAKESLKKAQQEITTSITDSALGKSNDIYGAVKNLRNEIFPASNAALETIKNTDKKIDLKPLFEKASLLSDELKKRSSVESESMANKLIEDVDYIKKLHGESVDPLTAKSIIQGIDPKGNYSFNAAKFDNDLSPFYRQLRYTLDDSLKEAIPEYKAAMKPLAEKSSLLKKLDIFGTPEDALKNISKLKNEVNYKIQRPLLEELEKYSENKFLQDIDKYADKEIQSKLLKALPEHVEHQKLAESISHLRNPETLKTLLKDLESSPEKAELLKHELELKGLEDARAQLGGLTEANLEGRLKTVMAGRNTYMRKVLDRLGFEGKTVPEILDLIKVKESFDKSATNGSRNVNMYSILASTLGGAALGGFMGAGIGAGVGSAIGGTVDKYGPAITKKLLDSYIKMFSPIMKEAGVTNKDAVKIALYNVFSGEKKNVNAESFVNTVKFIDNAMKADSKISRLTNGILNAGKSIEIDNISDSTIKKINKKLDEFSNNPESILRSGDSISHYLPNHGASMVGLSTRVSSYLNSIRPKEMMGVNFLDPKIKPNKQQIDSYNRQVQIALNPLLVLKHIKEGTLLPRDVQNITTCNPALYNQLSKKLTEEIISAKEKGLVLQNKVRVSASLFLKNSLDSTLSPAGILSTQNVFMQNGGGLSSKQKNQINLAKSKIGSNNLNKVFSMYQTPSERRYLNKHK